MELLKQQTSYVEPMQSFGTCRMLVRHIARRISVGLLPSSSGHGLLLDSWRKEGKSLSKDVRGDLSAPHDLPKEALGRPLPNHLPREGHHRARATNGPVLSAGR